ncbi:MAG: diaminopimelate epimerase [Holosporaceae bacterium]|jgi:diaminopimelate epimerase|nr:diaminopimelate epimerase [Holosporaceae bacterium]
MLIKFDKMQALGNDFIMIDMNQFSKEPLFDDFFFSNISNRNYGVGCDLTVLYKLRHDDIYAEFFNSDGSGAEICGNAARCLGVLMKKRNRFSKCTLKTAKKDYPISVNGTICIKMGRPSFKLQDAGVSKSVASSSALMDELSLPADIGVYHAVCISVGNPHLVLFCKCLPEEKEVIALGDLLGNHSLFENRINVSFAHVVSESEITTIVYERGVGLTKACGSGACATAAAAFAHNIVLSRNVLVKQKGGTLIISRDSDGNIFQSGPAFLVFSGEIEI